MCKILCQYLGQDWGVEFLGYDYAKLNDAEIKKIVCCWDGRVSEGFHWQWECERVGRGSRLINTARDMILGAVRFTGNNDEFDHKLWLGIRQQRNHIRRAYTSKAKRKKTS